MVILPTSVKTEPLALRIITSVPSLKVSLVSPVVGLVVVEVYLIYTFTPSPRFTSFAVLDEVESVTVHISFSRLGNYTLNNGVMVSPSLHL
jgi:hypothetical protein